MKKLLLLSLIFIYWSVNPLYTQSQTSNKPPVTFSGFQPGHSASHEDAVQKAVFQDYNPDWWLQDSSYYFTWMDASSTWFCNGRDYLTHNANGSVAEDLYIIFNDVTLAWENDTRYVYQYYPSGNSEINTGQAWNKAGSAWVDFSMNHYDYLGRMDTSLYKAYDRVNNVFDYGFRSYYSFNSSNYVIENVNQQLDTATSSWYNNSRISYTYDPGNHPLTMISQIWDTGLNDWKNDSKYEYSYDGSGFTTGYIQYFWNAGTAAWENYKKAIYTNNASGMPTEKLYQLWDSVPGGWNNSERLTCQYNSYNQPTQILDELADTASLTWSNFMKDTYSYFSNHQPWEHYQYAWNPNTSAYMDVYYSLNDSTGHQLEYYSKSLDWQAYEYIYGFKYIFTYTPFNSISEALEQLLDLNSFAWYDFSRTLYTYDGDDNNTVELNQGYDTVAATWNNVFKKEHYYSFTTGEKKIPGTSDYCFYSNPLEAGKTVVCPDLASGKNYRISLISMQGQPVYTAIIHQGESFTVPRDLSSGMYLMQLMENGNLVASGKVIVTR